MVQATSLQDNTLDKILEDLKKLKNTYNPKNGTPLEELSVKQLIQRFDHVTKKNDSKNEYIIKKTNDIDEVLIRNKNYCTNSEMSTNVLINRHSDELNKLLEELTKVTCAPLMTPGATSSLIQMKSDGLTDEEVSLFIHISTSSLQT